MMGKNRVRGNGAPWSTRGGRVPLRSIRLRLDDTWRSGGSCSKEPKSDDHKDSQAKTVLREAFAAAGLSAEIEVYAGTLHGWYPPDSAVYHEVQAGRAWSPTSGHANRRPQPELDAGGDRGDRCGP